MILQKDYENCDFMVFQKNFDLLWLLDFKNHNCLRLTPAGGSNTARLIPAMF